MRAIVLAALMLGVGAVRAQGAAPAPAAGTAPAEQPAPAAAPAPAPSVEVFVPSEKISADSSVAFPVDI